MEEYASGKVTAERLRRDAYLYVRQSTLYQVTHNTESTARQYDLRGRAIALGWPAERVRVIDVDQGRSGASSADRVGFQRLVAEVSLGKAGIVLGLECSRLARNNADWHRLLEICAINQTLICDEDGLYDPCSFNDRMLLGLKGSMSEAELYLLRARLTGGLLAKARRGELHLRLPVGLVYDPAGKVVLDPDTGVRHALQQLFAVFARSGSARAVVKHFRDQHLAFPAHHHPGGPHGGELYFTELRHDTVLSVLHNPRYAGAFCYGRSRESTDLQGKHHTQVKPRDQWTVLIHDAHPGYLTYPQFEANLATLIANAPAHGPDRKAGPPREGPALLQGLVICGKCGQRMSVGYHARAGGTMVPDYDCHRESISRAFPQCQFMGGSGIDAAVTDLVLRALTPVAVQAALNVSSELAARAQEADRIRAGHVERARFHADAARRRYLAVDPANRLVAESLEADWNERLRDLATAQDTYDHAKDTMIGHITALERTRLARLTADLPALWAGPATTMRDRKRLLRLLVTDVTLLRTETGITAHVRLSGGQYHTLSLPLPRTAWEQHTTDPGAIAAANQLLDQYTCAQSAEILNQQGWQTGWGKPFTGPRLQQIINARGLPSHYERLRQAGMQTMDEVCAQFAVTPQTIKRWHALGLITAHRYDGRGSRLYHPGQHRPTPEAITSAENTRRTPTARPSQPAHQPRSTETHPGGAV